jgi:hypothetical protein
VGWVQGGPGPQLQANGREPVALKRTILSMVKKEMHKEGNWRRKKKDSHSLFCPKDGGSRCL